MKLVEVRGEEMARKENGQDGRRDTKKLLFVPPDRSGRGETFGLLEWGGLEDY